MDRIHFFNCLLEMKNVIWFEISRWDLIIVTICDWNIETKNFRRRFFSARNDIEWTICNIWLSWKIWLSMTALDFKMYSLRVGGPTEHLMLENNACLNLRIPNWTVKDVKSGRSFGVVKFSQDLLIENRFWHLTRHRRKLHFYCVIKLKFNFENLILFHTYLLVMFYYSFQWLS